MTYGRLKKITIFIILFALLYLALSTYRGYRFYNSIFRLSYEEISSLLEKPTQCKKFSECKLLPGDIIIRRYVTEVTNLFDELLNPYFTHSAIYLGNDEIFEAVGNNVPPKDQITITKLSESDWFFEDVENFVVIRPKNKNVELANVMNSLREVANNPEYVFGPLDEKQKTASCSDVILKYLENEKIVKNNNSKPEIITPDYLFLITNKDTDNFETVGYNINNKI